MTKLTEDIIMQRLRHCSSHLESITQINITGRDLDDISLLKKMTSIEVLSLSVNKISSLRDLQFCKFLKELYLRKNNINDINEIYYLRELNYLMILGLSQNPCSNIPDYRLTVVRTLPKLERLDDIPIAPEERVVALRKGLKVTNPEETAQETDNTVSDREILLPPSQIKSIEKPQSESVLPFQPDSKSEEPKKTSNHNLNNSGITNSNSVGKCLRMDSSPPEKNHNEVSILDRPMPTAGVNHSNLLPGILVLVTDLDYYSLEILSTNIKNRLNQYQMNNLSKH